MKTIALRTNSMMLAAALLLFSCDSKEKKAGDSTANSTELKVSTPIQNHVMTAEEQAALTPEMVLQDFKDGNERFRNNNLTVRDHKEQVRKSAPGQYPKAVVLSCLDSRVPVEDVF